MILYLFCPQWALNSSVTALAMKGLVLEGRTTDQIRKKALEILKKFKISYKKRNSPGNSSGLPVVHRYEELAKACGNLVQLPLLMGSEGNKRTGGGDRKRNLPPTPGRSRPVHSPLWTGTWTVGGQRTIAEWEELYNCCEGLGGETGRQTVKGEGVGGESEAAGTEGEAAAV